MGIGEAEPDAWLRDTRGHRRLHSRLQERCGRKAAIRNRGPLDESLDAFWMAESNRLPLRLWIDSALREDRVDQDLATEALLGGPERSHAVVADVTSQEPGVSCGALAALECFRSLDPGAEGLVVADDGTEVAAGTEVLRVRATPGAILGAERTALNLWSHLSGIATQTRKWTRLCPGVKILDTRKTLPGIRRFQKHAVRCGGGANHRFDLAEFPMVKENHRKLFREAHLPRGASSREEICAIVAKVRARTSRPLEVEVEDLESFLACVESGVELILLDNQTPETISSWIETARRQGLTVTEGSLEASGGITEGSLAAYGTCGVQRISMGALTHSVKAWDLSLHVRWATEA